MSNRKQYSPEQKVSIVRRHLVKDRMERSGMRWTLEGARAMLNVRAAFQSDH